MSGLGRMAGRVLGAVWPRGAAERFAARVFAGPDVARDLLLESALPLVGDDTFELDEAGVDLGDPVLSDFPGCNCAGARAADLMDHRPDCAARTGLRPAGVCAPPTPTPAGHLNIGHDELAARILASFGYRRYDLRRLADNAASDLLAEYRIQRSTPPAPFTTFRDIAHAAQLILAYSDEPDWADENARLATRALANRLAEAAADNPHP